MKKTILATLLVLASLASAPAQTKPPDLSNYDAIATVGGVAILLDTKDATAKGSVVTFSLLFAAIVTDQGRPALDYNNHTFLTVRADCDTHRSGVVRREGRKAGQPFAEDAPEVKLLPAAPDSPEDKIVSMVCREKVGLSAE